MRLKEIVDDVRKKKRNVPYVADSPVADALSAAGGGPVQELDQSKEAIVEIEDEGMVSKMDTTTKFVNFVLNELGIENPIKVSLVDDREKHGLKTLAHYDEDNKHCTVYSKGRNLADVLRSVAHELVHGAQFEKGKINGPVQDIGGPIEDEANAMAGQLVKKFGYENKEIFE